MKKAATVVLALLALGPVGAAADEDILEPGAYVVEMRLALPHLEDASFSKTSQICVTDSPTRGLTVLSDNNPLAACPTSNIREAGGTLTFDIVCEGQNQGNASARFTLYGDRFEGVFNMKMGGKNMTMTERQSGRRVGGCEPAPRS